MNHTDVIDSTSATRHPPADRIAGQQMMHASPRSRAEIANRKQDQRHRGVQSHRVEEAHAIKPLHAINVARKRADLALHREFAHALDELVARLAVGDEVGNRDQLQPVPLRESGDVRATQVRALEHDRVRACVNRRRRAR